MKKVNWIREELSAVRRGANRHNEHAMYELATRYLTGRGVAYDEVAGLYWACQAAVHKNPKGMVLAACCLIRGIGVEEAEPLEVAENLKEAVGWLEDAARMGSPAAYYNLGNCYLFGIGKPSRKKTALLYYRVAAKLGYKRAESAYAAALGANEHALKNLADSVRMSMAA